VPGRGYGGRPAGATVFLAEGGSAGFRLRRRSGGRLASVCTGGRRAGGIWFLIGHYLRCRPFSIIWRRMENSNFEIKSLGPWPLRNTKTGAHYTLVRADQLSASVDNLNRLIEVNNEPAIYNFLWRQPLNGAPYDEAKARSFFEWSARGWSQQTYFVFVVLNSSSEICAATDIKSNQRSRTEIGYWVSKNHAGLASPMVEALRKIARVAGVESLFAHVRADNPRSAAVLEKNHFVKHAESDLSKGCERYLFEQARNEFKSRIAQRPPKPR
jgi:RimJ/RimL family protein N-acetyltransferase